MWLNEMAQSGIPKDLWGWTLTTLTEGSKGGNVKRHAQAIGQWIDGKTAATGVLISGPTGRGKTTTAVAMICERACNRPGSVRVVRESLLWQAVSGDWKAKAAIGEAMGADYLLIDDMGRTSGMRELAAIKQLYHMILDARMFSRSPTVATSELDPISLGQWMGDQASARRIVELFSPPSGIHIPLTGADLTLEARR